MESAKEPTEFSVFQRVWAIITQVLHFRYIIIWRKRLSHTRHGWNLNGIKCYHADKRFASFHRYLKCCHTRCSNVFSILKLFSIPSGHYSIVILLPLFSWWFLVHWIHWQYVCDNILDIGGMKWMFCSARQHVIELGMHTKTGCTRKVHVHNSCT